MMTDKSEADSKTTTAGTSRGKLTLGAKTGTAAASVQQSFARGQTKTVAVEVRKTRDRDPAASPRAVTLTSSGTVAAAKPAAPSAPAATPSSPRNKGAAPRTLSDSEREARQRALQAAATAAPSTTERARPVMPQVVDFSPPAPKTSSPAASKPIDKDSLRARELAELKQIQDAERQQAAEAEKKRREQMARNPSAYTNPRRNTDATGAAAPSSATSADQARAAMAKRAGEAAAAKLTGRFTSGDEASSEADRNRKAGRGGLATRRDAEIANFRMGRMNIEQAMETDGQPGRSRSIASMRRRAEKFARKNQLQQSGEKVIRDVVIPEVITVGDLATRMAERGADVVKALMKMGVMATITQSIDADTAELIVGEFGHRFKRVTEADVLQGLGGGDDAAEQLQARPPVVTVMGHVDHGKTSLLDAFRAANVVAKEAGGITQHIGAYQITTKDGQKVTFIDTPGHAAFTEMRARGANVTDVVILVVAADDSIMPQTVEAIRHAKAAGVPIVVAVNKCDLPSANPMRVKQDLLQYDIQVEDMGGETLAVDVSAKTKLNLDKLLEAVLLQAEVLDLKANPNRSAEGKIIEAKLDKGRGAVATVLVQRGTLKVGDIFVSGSEWGRVRALLNDRGEALTSVGPATPVEVQGASAVPAAGDDFVVVENEARAREVADFRLRQKRQLQAAAAVTARGSLSDMMAASASTTKELAVVIKGDVHGSVEAIKASLEKLTAENTEVKVRVLDASVGAISEADINLARASKGEVIAFNVRAAPQAREMAKRDGIEIRYYSVIYNIIDDVRQMLGGMLSPLVKENFIGYAEILQVFNITKVGKVAGCRVTEGIVRRGAGVRLLRDNTVIHEGKLKTLKREKDEVKEVRDGYECGMAFENYENIQVGDRIECFETTTEARTLESA